MLRKEGYGHFNKPEIDDLGSGQDGVPKGQFSSRVDYEITSKFLTIYQVI